MHKKDKDKEKVIKQHVKMLTKDIHNFTTWYNRYRSAFWLGLLSLFGWLVLIIIGSILIANNQNHNTLAGGIVLIVFGLLIFCYNLYAVLLLLDSIKAQKYRYWFKIHYTKKMYSLKSHLDYLADENAILDYNLFKNQIY